jgi:hypothetical protein
VSWTSLGSFSLPAANVDLSPSGIGLAFSFPGGITVPAGEQMAALFRYTVDPPPPILDGFGVRLDPTGASSLTGIVTYSQKTPGSSQFGKSGTLNISLSGDAAQHYVLSDFQSFNFPANLVQVTLFITVGGTDEAATSNGGTSGAVGTPEPAAIGFVGFGLATLAMLRRRFAR